MEKIQKTVSEDSLKVSEEMLNQYLESLSRHGKSGGTIQSYRHSLYWMYRLLPENNRIQRKTFEDLRKNLLADGYAASTVNCFTAAVNGFLEYMDCRNIQVLETLKSEKDTQPELTREEYLKLLSAARSLGRERVYLLIKVIASTGVMLSKLSEVTVEAARTGRISLPGAAVHIPSLLCEELLGYAERHGIREGAIFVTRSGREINRSNLHYEIKNLAKNAHVVPEKCSLMALRRLYQSTQEDIRSGIEFLMEQAGDHLMEEQRRLG